MLMRIFENLGAAEILPVREQPRDIRAMGEESSMTGKVIEGGNSIPVIDKKPDCVCDDQGPYTNPQEMVINKFMELGHTPHSIWTGRDGILGRGRVQALWEVLNQPLFSGAFGGLGD